MYAQRNRRFGRETSLQQNQFLSIFSLKILSNTNVIFSPSFFRRKRINDTLWNGQEISAYQVNNNFFNPLNQVDIKQFELDKAFL